ncbi:Nucleus accumbens-associated protein 2 [Takifugu flavidus]|uniref:Nucleus accumbens-associated protein 2 n=1 Tax=Takifugu flavidus TaxID=433684 RepID=A0A5C6PNB5_9TELE|nr:Nucleus accumbens-associated protein 2 [Takifugu flavidus]
MAGDGSHAAYPDTEAFCPSEPWSDEVGGGDGETEKVGDSEGCGHFNPWPPRFEVRDGLLYRKKLERGFIRYREVLDEDRRHEAIGTIHRHQRPHQHHLSLEETYKCVAESYWWEGMYFQIRDFVLGCPECQSRHTKKKVGAKECVSKTMTSHSAEMLSKLRTQREAGLFCDITLRTNGRPFPAHRAVLAAVSDHFQEIFTEMDPNMKQDIDLTGFSEDSLRSLLDFSYSSTLCVRQEDLPEVMAMARHLGMWPALEACSALMNEQEQQLHRRRCFTSACAGACHECHHQQRNNRRKRVWGLEDNVDNNFSLAADASDGSVEGSPRRTLRRTPNPQDYNGLTLTPSHRMKLMDFKSPSSKKVSAPQHAVATPKSQKFSPISPPNTRLLRSTPGAAKEVRRLIPALESPRQKKKPLSVSQLICSPVKVKQEVVDVGEDEQDYERAQEKYRLMNVLGLQRTALLPRPEDLIGWRQKKRLRKLKANNYSLTKRRKPQPASTGRPFGSVTLSLPLCNPVNTCLLKKSGKNNPAGAGGVQQMKKRPKTVPRLVPPSDRSMRSKGAVPDIFLPSFSGRELRRSVRMRDRSPFPVQQPVRHHSNKTVVRNIIKIKPEPDEYEISGPPFSSSHTPEHSLYSQRTQMKNKVATETTKKLRYNSGRPATKAKVRQGSTMEVDRMKCKPREEGRKVGGHRVQGTVDPNLRVNKPDEFQFPQQAPPPSVCSHPLYRVIKKEPAEPVPVASFSDPPSPDRGKRQSKPPIKLLDSGFLFSFCRPAGLKKEEESVDICLTRSVSQISEAFAGEAPHRVLRARAPSAMAVIKKEQKERSVSQSTARRSKPKSRNGTVRLSRPAGPKASRTKPKQEKPCVMLDAIGRARLKQLRGPRSQAPKVPKASHTCLECPAVHEDCDALIMHRLRHVEGKHWPCPVSSC